MRANVAGDAGWGEGEYSLRLERETALEVDARLEECRAAGWRPTVGVVDERGLSASYLDRIGREWPVILGPLATRRGLAERHRLAEEVRELRRRGQGLRGRLVATLILVASAVATTVMAAGI